MNPANCLTQSKSSVEWKEHRALFPGDSDLSWSVQLILILRFVLYHMTITMSAHELLQGCALTNCTLLWFLITKGQFVYISQKIAVRQCLEPETAFNNEIITYIQSSTLCLRIRLNDENPYALK